MHACGRADQRDAGCSAVYTQSACVPSPSTALRAPRHRWARSLPPCRHLDWRRGQLVARLATGAARIRRRPPPPASLKSSAALSPLPIELAAVGVRTALISGRPQPAAEMAPWCKPFSARARQARTPRPTSRRSRRRAHACAARQWVASCRRRHLMCGVLVWALRRPRASAIRDPHGAISLYGGAHLSTLCARTRPSLCDRTGSRRAGCRSR